MSGPRSITQKDLKLLWGRAAARCSKCRLLLTADATDKDEYAILGEMAHIIAHGDAGPRADTSLSDDERRSYSNLILLCPTCHELVDKQANSFTCGDLRQWKHDHEAWVRTSLSDAMPAVSFAELEVVAKAIAGRAASPTDDWSLTPPSQKLLKNGLSDEVAFLVQQGMLKTREVHAYLANMSTFDDDFAERLKAGFVAEYESRRSEGLNGDALFESIRVFAAGRGDFKRAAAGLAVTVYLFETCEIFER